MFCLWLRYRLQAIKIHRIEKNRDMFYYVMYMYRYDAANIIVVVV